jgi:hypothetical protein
MISFWFTEVWHLPRKNNTLLAKQDFTASSSISAMASSLDFNINTQLSSTPGLYSGTFRSPGPTGSSQHMLQQFQGQFAMPLINPQLNMTPSRQSLSEHAIFTPLSKLLTQVSLPLASQQTSSLLLPPPTQPPWQPHMDSSFSFDGQSDFQDMTKSEVNPSFIDALGQSMGFSEGDKGYCKGLHVFPKVCLKHSPVNTTQILVSW